MRNVWERSWGSVIVLLCCPSYRQIRERLKILWNGNKYTCCLTQDSSKFNVKYVVETFFKRIMSFFFKKIPHTLILRSIMGGGGDFVNLMFSLPSPAGGKESWSLSSFRILAWDEIQLYFPPNWMRIWNHPHHACSFQCIIVINSYWSMWRIPCFSTES